MLHSRLVRMRPHARACAINSSSFTYLSLRFTKMASTVVNHYGN